VRVAIAALGSRGDVWPYVLLGRALREAGHDVLISAMGRFRGLVEEASLGFHTLPGDPMDLSAVRLDVSPWHPLHHLSVIRNTVSGLIGQAADPELLLHPWAERDFVVLTPSTTFAYVTATELGARCAMVVYLPTVPTGTFAHPVLTPRVALGTRGNLASWLLVERLLKPWFREPLRPAARRAWRLPAFPLATRRQGIAWPPVPLLHAYSPEVVPRPRDWPAHVSVTGWLLPEPSHEPLPERVERFLEHGPPPIFIGFGSMPVPNPERTAQIVVTALSRTGQRAIVCGAGLAHASALHSTNAVLTAEELPFEDVLHRVSAVVHHGGSGSVGAGLRSGKPTLVTPFVFDQFFWGERVRDLGVGPTPIPFRRLSEDRLARALADLASGRYDIAARRLGERIRAEDSVGRAVEEIERVSDGR
jgi:sterol 3beta-glucosyltransferase